MTDRADSKLANPTPPVRPRAKAKAPPTPDWLLIAATSLTIFFLMFAFMAWRVRTGNDPVLGAMKTKPIVRQHKIKRIVVIKKVIVTVLPPKQVAAAAPAYAYSAPRSSAPAYQAPVNVVYAPAPAPVSRGS